MRISPIPIWQAPTGSVAGPELCAAVTRAGGMGAIGMTWTGSNEARRKVEEVRRLTGGLFTVNFALHFKPTSLVAVLESGVPAVSFSWGIPSEHSSVCRSFGCSVGVQVTNRLGARQALDIGADFLVCQGVEAGGHVQGVRSLWQILSEVIEEAGAIPVIAAGGIGDAAGIARALDLGATAAMMGTRFVATRESLAHPVYKQRIVEASSADLTICFDGGWPNAVHRVLRNRTLDEWEAAGCPPPGLRPGEGDELASMEDEKILRYEDTAPRIGMTGSIDEMCLYSGLSCASIEDIPSAEDLVKRLWSEVRRMRERPQDSES